MVKKENLLDNSSGIIKQGCLVKLKPFEKEPKWICIGAEPPTRISAQKISDTGNFGQALIGKKVGDIVNIGNGFKVLEIKSYLSK